MFTRSRRNLAYWFAGSMGSILVLFAGVSYSLSVEEQLQAFDQTLFKQGKAIATGAPFRLYDERLPMRHNNPLFGDTMPLNSELVYARWYNAAGDLVQFFGTTAPGQLNTTMLGFQTLQIPEHQPDGRSTIWLRQATLPVLRDKQVIGYLQVAAPLSPLRESLSRTRLFLALGVPATLGVIGVTGWVLGGLALQPTRRAYEQLQRFTADASHELRAPLAAILSNAQVGLMAADDRTQQQVRLEKIVEGAKSMSALISNLLFLSRHEGAFDPNSLKSVDLVELLRSLIHDQTALATSQGLTLTHTLPDQPVTLKADPDLLKQAITNLLSNAFKYTPSGGTVHLHLLTQSHRAIIRVEDSGIGIPEADLPHIFERFYRVDTVRSRQTGGFGLGLAIAQQIIQAHRGQITASSQIEQGSTFQIDLPLKS